MEVTKRSSIIKVQHSGAACVRILCSPRAIWFYWSTNVARARSRTLLKCYAQSQNARNSDSGELRNACPSSKNFSILQTVVGGGPLKYRGEMDLSLLARFDRFYIYRPVFTCHLDVGQLYANYTANSVPRALAPYRICCPFPLPSMLWQAHDKHRGYSGEEYTNHRQFPRPPYRRVC